MHIVTKYIAIVEFELDKDNDEIKAEELEGQLVGYR